MKRVLVAVFFFILIYFSGVQLSADDSGADITPSGITFKKIPGISMEKEILIISKDKIDVTFLFKNNTNKDIETEVAFPIPPFPETPYGDHVLPYNDLSIWINEKPIEYKTEIKALLDGMDYTELLNNIGVSITDFKGDTNSIKWSDIEKLVSLHLLERSGDWWNVDYFARWEVSITYHWLQVFPARKTVKIRHTYKPIAGQEESMAEDWLGWTASSEGGSGKLVPEWIENNYGKKAYLSTKQINYILKTANNWGGPIKDFTLKVKCDPSEKFLCFSDLSVPGEKTSHYLIKKKNYIPTQDLEVIFFKQLPQPDQ